MLFLFWWLSPWVFSSACFTYTALYIGFSFACAFFVFETSTNCLYNQKINVPVQDFSCVWGCGFDIRLHFCDLMLIDFCFVFELLSYTHTQWRLSDSRLKTLFLLILGNIVFKVFIQTVPVILYNLLIIFNLLLSQEVLIKKKLFQPCVNFI